MRPPPRPAPPVFWPFKRVFFGWGIVSASTVIAFAQVPMYGTVLSVFVTPISEELGWTRAEISAAFAIGSLCGAAGAAAIGSSLDRYGARMAIVIAGLTITAALAGLALMQEVWQFWALFGIGRTAALTGVHMGTMVAVGNWFVSKRGRAVSFISIGLRAGQALVPLAVATPLIIAYSWRHAYAALAVMTFALIVIPGWLFIRRRPEDYGMLPDGAPASAADPRRAGGADTSGEVSFTLAEARRTPAFWLLTVATMIVFFAQTAVNVHAVPSVEARGAPREFSGAFVFIIMGTAAVSAYGWGALMDKFHARWGAALATALSCVAMAMLIFADNIPMAAAFGVVFGLGTGGWTVAQVVLFANYFGRRHLGAIRGLSQLLSGPFAATGAILAGWIYDARASYTLAFLIFLVALLAALFAVALAKPPRKPSPVASPASGGA